MVTIPTLSELYSDVISDIENEFGSSVPVFGKNFLRARALVQAGKLKIIYLILARLQKNIFVDLADPESTGGTLERFGRVKIGRNPNPAIHGEYEATITGTIGSVILGETTLKSIANSTGKLYVVEEDFELATNPDVITIRALEAGTESRLIVSEGMVFTTSISGVNQSATITAETVIPEDSEDIEDYRQAVIQAFQLEPQGGAASDYRIWAQDVSGIYKIYPYAKYGQPADVIVYVEAIKASSIDGKGTPSSTKLLEVAAVFEQDPDTTLDIDERGRRPLGVFTLDVVQVEVMDITITIPNFSGITSTKQTAINAALEESIDLIRPFISGADILELQDDVLDVNRIISVILTTYPGSSFDTPILAIDGNPVSTYTFSDGYIPYLDSVSYT